MAGDDKPDLCETTSQISRKRLGMGQSLWRNPMILIYIYIYSNHAETQGYQQMNSLFKNSIAGFSSIYICVHMWK